MYVHIYIYIYIYIQYIICTVYVYQHCIYIYINKTYKTIYNTPEKDIIYHYFGWILLFYLFWDPEQNG